MDDKRQFNRWLREGEDTAVVCCAAEKEEGHILDVSAGGMRLTLHHAVNVGETIYGQFNVMDFPYYIKGKVNRAVAQGEDWEIAISFEKVSSIPITA